MLSKSGVHAIRAAVALATLPEGEYQGTSLLANRANAPRNYLGKLLQQLSRRGLVESQKGLRGGFRLARHPSKITIFDVVESIEDVSRWSRCIFGEGQCSDSNPCPVHNRWVTVRDAYLKMLRYTSIADILPLNEAWDKSTDAISANTDDTISLSKDL